MKKITFLILLTSLCRFSWAQQCIDPSIINPGAVCITLYDPVCGCNGVTYGNSCEARQNGVVSYTPGACGSIDTKAPSVPTGLSLNNIQCITTPCPVGIKWNPSTDNVGVKGYNIYLNNTKIATTTTTELIITRTGYYSVSAFDAAGNVSGQSTVIYVQTPCMTTPKTGIVCTADYNPVCGCNGVTYSNACAAGVAGVQNYVPGECGKVDAQSPSAPQNLRNTTILPSCHCEITYMSVSWDAAYDNKEVAGYKLYLNNSLYATTTSINYTFNNLVPGTTYNVFVVAYDAAGNHSAPSQTLTYTLIKYPLLPPADIKVSNITGTSFDLSWNDDPNGRWFNNTLVYKEDGTSLVATIAANVYTTKITGLMPYTSYSYIIKSQNPSTDEISSTFKTIQVFASDCKVYNAGDKIEAENWCRMSGVQTENTTDIGGGLNVGWIDAYDNMSYVINVPVTGYYKVSFRVASVNGGTFQVQNGSSDLMFSQNYPCPTSLPSWGNIITVPATGAWQSWTTLSFYVKLNAGISEYNLYTQKGGFNINWLQVAAANPGTLSRIEVSPSTASVIIGNGIQFRVLGFDQNNEGTCVSPVWKVSGGGTISTTGIFTASSKGTYTITATQGNLSATAIVTVVPSAYLIEAESYSSTGGSCNGGGVQKENCAEGGQNIGWIDNCDWTTYDNLNLAAGTYQVDIRYAGLNNGKIRFEKAGGSPQYAEVDIPATGGWQNWQFKTVTISITEYTQNLGIYFPVGGFNINWYNFTPVSLKSANLATAISDVPDKDVEIYPVPMAGQLNLKVNNGQFHSATIIDISGKIVLKQQLDSSKDEYQIDVQKLNKGIYFLRLDGENKVVNKKLIK